MIAPFRILIALVLQALIATAAPVGICLHAFSPEAPPEKIECFEFEKVERAASDYRFFPSSDKSVMVTAYRFRGTIPYKPELAPTHPEFDKLLKLYEETARATPSTRPYLNPKILVMRSQTAGGAKQAESLAQLPTITLADGTQLTGCTMSKIENGFVSIRHQDGISKVSMKELDATEKKALNSTAEGWSLEDPTATPKDSTGTFAKIVFKNGVLLKKAKFKEVADGNLVFIADGKSVSVPADQFPGELSVLGEEAVKSFAPVKKEASHEPSVASSGGANSSTAPVQAKRSGVASGGGFNLPEDDASEGGFVLQGDEAPNEAYKKFEKTAVDKSTLQSRNNSGKTLLYLPNGEVPYTGWIKEASSDGGLELTQIKNGVLEGIFVAYLKSGQKKIEGVNKNGKKNGKQTDWYKNGQKDTELIFENGNVLTLVSKYKPNGDQCQESKVENGSGKTLTYDEKGDIIATLTYESGVGTFKFNKPDPDKYTVQDMEALLEQELRINHLKSKLEDSGNYSDKTFFFARIQSICDTDWSKCSPQLSICANTLKRTIDLYSSEKASFEEVLNTSKAFLEISSKRTKTFVFVGIDMSKMIDETRRKIGKEEDYK